MVVTKKSQTVDTNKWLSRNEASDLLGVSTVTLLNYERKGILHPQQARRPDRRGIEHSLIVYDPQELAKVPRSGRVNYITPRDPGEIAARCFELFDRGSTLREAVIDQREHPDKIRDLHDKWLDMGGANFVISPGAKEELEKCLGPFGNVAELIELVRELKQPRTAP
jgi:hypothetical protein